MVNVIFEQVAQQLGAGLNAQTAVVVMADHATGLTKGFRISKMEGVIQITPSDTASEDNLFLFLLCDGALSDAEIENLIELAIVDPDADKHDDAIVQSHRVDFLVDANGTPIFLDENNMSVGFAMKVNRSFHEGAGWKIVMYNAGGSNMVAAPKINTLIKYYGVWLK